jgi:signal transduction histidine kinase
LAPTTGIGALEQRRAHAALRWPLRVPDRHQIALNAVVVVSASAIAALITSAPQWRPPGHVLVLIGLAVVTDLLPVETRTLRMSSSLTVLAVIMALFGPAPAVVAGSLCMVLDAAVHRISLVRLIGNLATFSTLGLVGGLVFQAIDLPKDALAFGGVVAIGYVGLTVLNFALLAALGGLRDPYTLTGAVMATYAPLIPWHLTSATIAGATVLAYGQAGLPALVALAGVLAMTAPLLRSAVVALWRADAMSALQAVSDERAVEVARLASDRARLLNEVLEVSDHERRRLAESLHDGPLQRLIALRQDLDEHAEPWLDATRNNLDVVLHETRAVMSAFHPAASTELGFEATVRAAAEPFLRGRVALEVEAAARPERLSDPLLCSVARELVTNAVKHAKPTRVRVAVAADEDGVTLEVLDDGRGIDSADAGSAVQAGHVGLAVARRRVEDAGGKLEIRTVPTGGTHVRVTLPGERLG